jgi:hypothetical protein
MGSVKILQEVRIDQCLMRRREASEKDMSERIDSMDKYKDGRNVGRMVRSFKWLDTTMGKEIT